MASLQFAVGQTVIRIDTKVGVSSNYSLSQARHFRHRKAARLSIIKLVEVLDQSMSTPKYESVASLSYGESWNASLAKRSRTST